MRSGLPYFNSLQGARAIAVLAVVACHLNASLSQLYGFDSRVLASGWNGVYFFFVLSGFLIARRLFVDGATSNLKNYFKRRLQRTWPAYFAVMLVLIVCGVRFEPNLWSYLTFTQNFFEPVTFLPSWTLAAEEQFYLLAPFLVLLFARTGLTSLLALIAVVVGVRYALNPGRTLLVAIDSLVMGCGIAFLEIRKPAWLDRLKVRPMMLTVVGLAIVYLPIVWRWGLSEAATWLFFAQGIGFSLVLIALLNPSFVLSRVLSSRPFFEMGRVSYSIYLVHVFAIAIAQGFQLAILPFVLASLALTAVLTLALYFSIEKRFLNSRQGS
ncbi:MAG TPA: acyltransferase [Bdellovibrionales bacterium]|nr:acyltransferase [Bdellovibrionales bacterium]